MNYVNELFHCFVFGERAGEPVKLRQRMRGQGGGPKEHNEGGYRHVVAVSVWTGLENSNGRKIRREAETLFF